MDQKITKLEEYYCDMGPHALKTAVHVKATVYLDAEELEQYHRNGLMITVEENRQR